MALLKKIIKLIWLVSLVSLIVTMIVKPSLPDYEELSTETINTNPEQSTTDRGSFELKVKNFNYQLTPRAEYVLAGLVVSQYDSSSWLDVMHKNDPINIQDVCLVWNENLINRAYQKVSYKSGEFTCFYHWSKYFEPPFKPEYLGNNHLIPANDKIAYQLKNINISDEIRLKGYLVDYKVSNVDNVSLGERTTSLTRNDTGNGACEVLLVTKVEVIKKHQQLFYWFKKNSFKFLAVSTIILIILFIYESQQARAGKIS